MVNYCNRNASVAVSNEQLGAAYAAASTASVATAVGLNKFVAATPSLANGIFGRFVPLVAVAAANCVNIPLMRQREMIEGITVKTKEGVEIGASKVAAQSAVATVVPSRILMAVPGMFLPPLLMSYLEKKPMLKQRPYLAAPLMVLSTGLCLTFSTPFCCALFPQDAAIDVKALEPELQNKVNQISPGTTEVYYNKGL
jgi:hypothetical protein